MARRPAMSPGERLRTLIKSVSLGLEEAAQKVANDRRRAVLGRALTHQELADRAGCQRVNFSKWIKPSHQIADSSTRQLLAKAFCVEAEIIHGYLDGELLLTNVLDLVVRAVMRARTVSYEEFANEVARPNLRAVVNDPANANRWPMHAVRLAQVILIQHDLSCEDWIENLDEISKGISKRIVDKFPLHTRLYRSH